jgi:uncharacterized protein
MRLGNVLVAAAATAVVLAPAAASHVTLNPATVKAGSFDKLDIRVPTERERASTTRVSVQLPPGLSFVAFKPKPGWRRTVTTARVNPPLIVFGNRITSRIATVTWTSTSAASRIGPGEFDEFEMTARVPETRGRTLVFPATQTYSNGEVVRWIGGPDADEPAPRVRLT